MEGDVQQFSSPSEEAQYWKKLARSYKQSLDETRAELDEFQTSSRELETELEAQLEQAESKIRDLTSANERLQRETDSLKERLEHFQCKTTGQMSELEDELAQTAAVKEELARYIRELEQHNDDLERAKRATVVSLEDFEGRLNSAIERNAFLESELDEKENLAVTVQRLKDEARDLRQELSVTNKPPKDELDSQTKTTEKSKSDTVIQSDQDMDSNRLVGHTPPPTPTRVTSTGFGPTGSNTPITPSARISALNIVGDLLRKVGALESKLASFRNYVKDQPLNSSGKTGAASPLNSPSLPEFLKCLRSPSSQNGHNA